jgi:hypothetical protein
MERLRSAVRERALARDSLPGAPGCLLLFTEVSLMSEKTLSKVKLDGLFLVPSALSQLYFVLVNRLAVSRQTLLLVPRGGLTGQPLEH